MHKAPPQIPACQECSDLEHRNMEAEAVSRSEQSEEGRPFPPLPHHWGKLPCHYSQITAWTFPEAPELSESFSLACGYINYCSLNGQSFSKSQNKYFHLRCSYESRTTQAPDTPSSALSSSSAGLFIARQSPGCCQDSKHHVSA